MSAIHLILNTNRSAVLRNDGRTIIQEAGFVAEETWDTKWQVCLKTAATWHLPLCYLVLNYASVEGSSLCFHMLFDTLLMTPSLRRLSPIALYGPCEAFLLHVSHPFANIYTHRATFVTKPVVWFIYSQNFLLFINSSAIKPGLNLWPQSSFVLTVGQNLISWHLRCNLWPCPWIYIHMFERFTDAISAARLHCEVKDLVSSQCCGKRLVKINQQVVAHTHGNQRR